MKKRIITLIIGILLISSITVYISSCKKPEPAVATIIEFVSGDKQTAEIGNALENPIEIIVNDQYGKAFPNATVFFTLKEGYVSSSTAFTDANGKASIIWTPGTAKLLQALTITAFKADNKTPLTGSPIIINASIQKKTSIELFSGGDQTAEIENILTNPIEIIITEENGDILSGITVNFEVIEGSVSEPRTTTDINGKASVTWTLGTTLENQKMTITAFENDETTHLQGSPLIVNATATRNYEKFTDPRDNRIYKIITIANTITGWC